MVQINYKWKHDLSLSTVILFVDHHILLVGLLTLDHIDREHYKILNFFEEKKCLDQPQGVWKYSIPYYKSIFKVLNLGGGYTSTHLP